MNKYLTPYKYAYQAIALILVLVFAIGVRIYGLDARPLWFDEAWEYWVATTSLQELHQSVREIIQDPPLYSYLLHFWMALGRSEFHLRFLSVVFSVMSVVGMIVLGYRQSGWLTGLIAGAIMAILPAQIRYAQDVGQYALMTCLLVWTTIALQGVHAKPSWSKCLAWAALAIATTYSYYGATFAVVVPFLVVLATHLVKKDWPGSLRLVTGSLLYGAGILPLVVYFLPGQLFRGPVSEAFSLNFSSPVIEITNLWTGTLKLVAFQFTGYPWTNIPLWVSVSLVGLLLLLAFREERSRKHMLYWLLSTWLTYFVIARIGLFPYGFRYGLILTPMLIAVISQSLASLMATRQYRWIPGSLVLMCILALAVISLPNRPVRIRLGQDALWAWPETQELEQVMQYWSNHRSPADPTYVYYGAAPAFQYYMDQYEGANPDLPASWFYQCWWYEPRDYCHANNIYYGAWTRTMEQADKITSIFGTLPRDVKSFWIVFSSIYPGEDQAILDGLKATYRIAEGRQATNASAYLLEQR